MPDNFSAIYLKLKNVVEIKNTTMHILIYFSKRLSEITVIVALLLGCFLVPSSIIRAQTLNHASLIIQDGNGKIQTFCISFEQDTITGYDLLQRTNLAIEAQFSPMGVAVCSIGNTGCPADNTCLKCLEPLYWSYWRLAGGTWVYSNMGTGMTQVKNGDVEAWVWGNGQTPPPQISFDEICKPRQPDQNKPTKTRKPTFLPASATLRTPTPELQTSKTATPLPTQTLPPTSSPFPDIPSTSAPTAVFIKDTSAPAVSEIVEFTPTSTIPTVESSATPAFENPKDENSGPPMKALETPGKPKDFYSLEATNMPDKEVSFGSSVLGILELIQNFFARLLP